MDGLIVVNKPLNMSSHDVVHYLKKKLKVDKIGHTGTLDPMASGVLLVCVGDATKLSNYLMSEQKEYQAVIRIGISTTTYDLEGEILNTKNVELVDEKIIDDCLQSFIGWSKQIPPLYSAIKKNGKKLYQYALQNEKVEVEPRDIEIIDIKRTSEIKHLVVNNINCIEFSLTTCVSKGTYIRSLAYDIGQKIGYPSMLSGLIRSENGGYLIKNSFNLDDIINGKYKIIPVIDMIPKIPKVSDENIIHKALHGMKISYYYIKDNYQIDTDLIAITKEENLDDTKLVAIYKKIKNENDIFYYKAERVWN